MKIDLRKITERQKLTIAKGLLDYRYIAENWKENSIDFQDVYYEFYLRARGAMRIQKNRDAYFQKLQSIKSEDDLIEIISDLSKKLTLPSNEFSIGSKMLHTINNNSPIYDSKVREYLFREEGVKLWWQIPNKESGAPRGTTELDKIKHDWNKLCEWYQKFLPSESGREWIEWFDLTFPEFAGISDVKKVDFIIFATN